MTNKEFGGSVEYTLKQTAEATGIVFTLVKPIAKATVENTLIAGNFFLPARSKSRMILGAIYYALFEGSEERGQSRVRRATI